MKELFPGSYRPSDEEFKKLWVEALFVFDANTLLNLYSYPDAAREIFLSVLSKIRDRAWIPYQVALEFHRNRFGRIKQSNEPLLILRDRIRASSEELERDIEKIEFEKRNTGVGDLKERLRAVRDANTQLAEALEAACTRLPVIGLDEPIGKNLAEFFTGRVGAPPSNQAEIDKLIEDGENRYERKIPPGYKDAKDKKDIRYNDRGLSYQAMYGDLILWRQTIAHIKNANIKNVIFVTGDTKDDWWLSIDKKILGPAPELVYELLTESGADRFWMYRPDQFLKNAERYLEASEITAETIAQIKDTNDQQQTGERRHTGIRQYLESLRASNSPDIQTFRSGDAWIYELPDGSRFLYRDDAPHSIEKPHSTIEHCVIEWANKRHLQDANLTNSYPPITVDEIDGKVYGYDITSPADTNLGSIQNAIVRAKNAENDLKVDVLILVIAYSTVAWKALDDDYISERYAADVGRLLFSTPLASAVIGYVRNGLFMPHVTVKPPRIN